MPETFLPLHFPSRDVIEKYLGRDKHIDKFMEVAGASANTFVWRDDFVGDTVNTTYRSMGTGTETISIATDTANGMASLTTDTNTGDSAGLSLGLHITGSRYPVVIARVKSATITTQKIEFGFTDAHADDGAVNNAATPTYTADDAAVWVMDRDVDVNWHTRAVAATVASTSGATDPAIAIAADAYQYLVVALEDSRARFYLGNADGRILHDSGWRTSAITGTVALTPWLFTKTRAASVRVLDVDFLWVWQRRTTAD